MNIDNYFIPLLGLLIGVGILTLLFTLFAFLEKGTKPIKLYEDFKYLYYYPLYLFIALIILISTLTGLFDLAIDSIATLVIVFIIKIAVAIWVGLEAKKLNRDSGLWGFLGFLEPHAAFLALAIGKRTYKVPESGIEEFKNLNNSTKEKVKAIIDLTGYKDSTKELKLKREYRKDFDELLLSVKDAHIKSSVRMRLKKAYETGAISKEEYEEKINNIPNKR